MTTPLTGEGVSASRVFLPVLLWSAVASVALVRDTCAGC
jgi:hypothetical protein